MVEALAEVAKDKAEELLIKFEEDKVVDESHKQNIKEEPKKEKQRGPSRFQRWKLKIC